MIRVKTRCFVFCFWRHVRSPHRLFCPAHERKHSHLRSRLINWFSHQTTWSCWGLIWHGEQKSPVIRFCTSANRLNLPSLSTKVAVLAPAGSLWLSQWQSTAIPAFILCKNSYKWIWATFKQSVVVVSWWVVLKYHYSFFFSWLNGRNETIYCSETECDFHFMMLGATAKSCFFFWHDWGVFGSGCIFKSTVRSIE